MSGDKVVQFTPEQYERWEWQQKAQDALRNTRDQERVDTHKRDADNLCEYRTESLALMRANGDEVHAIAVALQRIADKVCA